LSRRTMLTTFFIRAPLLDQFANSGDGADSTRADSSHDGRKTLGPERRRLGEIRTFNSMSYENSRVRVTAPWHQMHPASKDEPDAGHNEQHVDGELELPV
jgi:hypothetical protein